MMVSYKEHPFWEHAFFILKISWLSGPLGLAMQQMSLTSALGIVFDLSLLYSGM